jgi:cytochrome c biogenesis protein CcmG, thiol:disulfide interchange protein DsbE
MSPRVAILAGLLAGVVAATALLGAILAFAPEPVAQATPIPSVAIATPTPAPTPPTSAGPSASASASVEPSDSGAGGLFGVGQPAPTLVVPQVGGGTIDLANLRGQPVWVNFMGTYCPPCVDEFPLMEGFAARYAEDGLVVLAIDVREEEGVVAAFAERLGTTFPLGLDLDGSAADTWKAAAALPVHFWIDAEGIVRDGALGGIGPDIMARGLQTILPGVDVTVDP